MLKEKERKMKIGTQLEFLPGETIEEKFYKAKETGFEEIKVGGRQKVVINYGNKIEGIYEDTPQIIVKEDRAFIDAVKTKNSSSTKSTYEDTVKTLAFTLAANKSIETDKVEKVLNKFLADKWRK